ncbi:MAG: hypothetical protein DCC50_00725 [Acidobacteria bacterium]|nr:MAG: hypothetical protein DCC50_00725 [Acidobacteriota bacterium]
MNARLLAGATAMAAVALLAACTGGDGSSEPSPATSATTPAPAETADDQEPTEEDDAVEEQATLQPGEEVPEGMDVHDVKVFQIAIPSDWTPEQPADEPTLSFWGEDEGGAPAEGAIVAWDPQATSARQAADEFVAQLEADGVQPTLEPLEWPDVPEGGGFLVTFDDELAPGAVRHGQQIFAELPQGGVATVLAFATPDSYAASPVPEVLASFRAAP